MLFYLLITYCSVMTERCEVIQMPGPGYATEAECGHDGSLNSNANHEEIRDYTCVFRTVTPNGK